MPWHTHVHADPIFIETVYAGALTADELHAAVQETLRLAQEHRTHLLLGDCTALIQANLFADLYQMAERLAFDPLVALSREAMIMPAHPVARESVLFWQSTCYNHGLLVEVFDDRASALHWLREGK